MTTEEAVTVFERDIKNCNPLFERKFIEAETIAIQAIRKCEEYEKRELQQKEELKEHDAKVRAEVIDEFVALVNTMPTVEEDDGYIRVMTIEEMAEQLKEKSNEHMD